MSTLSYLTRNGEKAATIVGKLLPLLYPIYGENLSRLPSSIEKNAPHITYRIERKCPPYIVPSQNREKESTLACFDGEESATFTIQWTYKQRRIVHLKVF